MELHKTLIHLILCQKNFLDPQVITYFPFNQLFLFLLILIV